MNNKSFIIVVAILTAVAIAGYISFGKSSPDSRNEAQVAKFPKVIGRWESSDVPLEEQVYRILDTRNLFVREYQKPGDETMYLFIVYSKDDRKVGHPPEVCLMGGGAKINRKELIQINGKIWANKLLIIDDKKTDLVVYWYKAGKSYTGNYIKQQIKVVTDRMLGKNTASALIRVSTAINEKGEQDALGRIEKFCAEIEPLLVEYLP